MKKYSFYICLLIIYVLFLCKDSFYGLLNYNDLNNLIKTTDNSYYEKEYNDLLNLLDIELDNRSVIYTKTITREIYEFYDQITILKGTNSGIKKGDAVINSVGFIGVISEVYDNYSKVALITNSNTQISVKINDSYGILVSKDNKLYVKNIKLNNNINIGDEVYTSGLTNIPEGYLIGYVKNVNKDSLELEYIINIEDLNQTKYIKYVGVLLS